MRRRKMLVWINKRAVPPADTFYRKYFNIMLSQLISLETSNTTTPFHDMEYLDQGAADDLLLSYVWAKLAASNTTGTLSAAPTIDPATPLTDAKKDEDGKLLGELFDVVASSKVSCHQKCSRKI